MERSAAKSRIYKKRAVRRKRRRRLFIKRLFSVICAAVIVLAAVFAIKSGTELSKSIKYPVEYSDYIVKYSAENDLDPYLVIALIKQESNFIADAQSKYAGGLMQLTAVTAAEYGEKLGLKNYNYMDPETNIRIGCYLLRTLLDKYGTVDTALAAYNAGTGNVDSWLSNPEYSSDGVTLKYIPFSETRHYIRKINTYMEDYKQLVQLGAEEGETQ